MQVKITVDIAAITDIGEHPIFGFAGKYFVLEQPANTIAVGTRLAQEIMRIALRVGADPKSQNLARSGKTGLDDVWRIAALRVIDPARPLIAEQSLRCAGPDDLRGSGMGQ